MDSQNREYLSEEQRSQPGCPAREVVLDQSRHATSTRLAESAHTLRQPDDQGLVRLGPFVPDVRLSVPPSPGADSRK